MANTYNVIPRQCPYTTRLQKGGALLPDMRLLVRSWDGTASDFRAHNVVVENLLGKKSRARAIDTYRRAFLPRFIRGNPPYAWRIVRPLEEGDCSLDILRPVYYWITARSEPLMYDFASEWLNELYASPARSVRIDETEFWIRSKVRQFGKNWSPTVTTKVARGLLAALRDFGVLKGAAKKMLAPYYLPLESFAYIAFALHKISGSTGRVTSDPDWRLFFLSPPALERYFMEAHQQHLLEYYAAGSIVRVTFPAESFEGFARVVLGRAH